MAAIAAGILVSRIVPFEIRELLILIAALFSLGLLSLWRRNRALAAICSLLAFLFAGALTDVVHRPAAPPELDADGAVILSGCVVEPPVVAGDRARFVLELEPGARVQVTMYTAEGEEPPRLSYGQRIEFDAKVRRPHNFGNPGAFDYVHYLARQRHLLDRLHRVRALRSKYSRDPAARLFRVRMMNLRAAALGRIEQLYHGDDYSIGMMQAVLIGSSFQLATRLDRAVPRHGTFHAIIISGTHIAVLSGFLLLILRLCFVPLGSQLGDPRRNMALHAGDRMAASMRTLGSRVYALHDRAFLLSRAACHEPAGCRRYCFLLSIRSRFSSPAFSFRSSP